MYLVIGAKFLYFGFKKIHMFFKKFSSQQLLFKFKTCIEKLRVKKQEFLLIQNFDSFFDGNFPKGT